MPKHAAYPETGPMSVADFAEKFCDECKPVYQQMVDHLVRQAAENPCPPVFYWTEGEKKFSALRIGTWNSTWEVRIRVEEGMQAGPNEVGAWVHWDYKTDDEVAAAMARGENLASRS